MKKIKYKIIKFLYEYFKKIYIKNINIEDNQILEYAHNELIIAGHNKNSQMYNDIIGIIIGIIDCKFTSYTFSIINKLYNNTPITSLTLKNNEFEFCLGSKALYVNKRYNKIYKYSNKMFVTNAYSISPQYILSTKTKKTYSF